MLIRIEDPEDQSVTPMMRPNTFLTSLSLPISLMRMP
jgi:hypothetical protein